MGRSPKLVAEVEFRGWTADGMLRHASFKGLREDKDPREVVRETAKAPCRPDAEVPAILRRSRLTHPDRVLWEDVGLTKQGLAEFYADIAEWILPHIVEPAAVPRALPIRSRKECFFQKHAWNGMSKAVQHRAIVTRDESFSSTIWRA